MIEALDKELNINVLSLENQPNTYYISYQLDNKCVIDTVQEGNDVIVIPDPKESCTAEELTIVIDRFSNYIFKKYPEINGILMKMDENEILGGIGFKLLNENSEYLYKENKRMNKVK